MANLAINALTAKTPTTTDLIPVADPTTGIAGKSTTGQVAAQLTNVPITYSYTGTFDQLPEFVLAAPAPFQKEDGTIVGNESPWTAGSGPVFVAGSLNVTSFTYTNLVGATVISIPTGVTSVSFPSLKMVLGNFSFTTANPNLATVSAPVLEVVTGNFSFGTGMLTTTFNFPELHTAGVIQPATANLVSVNLPKLKKTQAFAPNGQFSSNLTSINVPVLEHIGAGGMAVTQCSGLTTLNFPSLLTCGNNFNPSSSSITTLNSPLLNTIVGNINPVGLNSLVSLSFPSLTRCTGSIQPNSCSSLTTINLPALTVLGERITSGNVTQFTASMGAVSIFNLGSTLKQVGTGAGNWIMTSCALNQASVDNILVRLAALDGTGGTTAFSSRTVTITGTSATPSATGLAAKSTLVARGCTVTNN